MSLSTGHCTKPLRSGKRRCSPSSASVAASWSGRPERGFASSSVISSGARRFAERACNLAVQVRDPLFLAFAAAGPRWTWRCTQATPGRRPSSNPSSPPRRPSAVACRVGYLREARRRRPERVDRDLAGAECRPRRGDPASHGVVAGQRAQQVRLAGVRQALGDLDGARAMIDDLRQQAARWDAGPLLTSQIDHRLRIARTRPRGVHGSGGRHTPGTGGGRDRPAPFDVIRALELLVSVAVAARKLGRGGPARRRCSQAA